MLFHQLIEFFKQLSRKVMYVNGSVELEAATNPATFQKMEHIVGGQFLVGDRGDFLSRQRLRGFTIKKKYGRPHRERS